MPVHARWANSFRKTAAMSSSTSADAKFGSDDLRLPDDLRGPLKAHMKDLRERYVARNWAGRTGWGERPALVIIDMTKFWLDSDQQIGSNLDSVVKGCQTVLAAAREVEMPIFFTTFDYDPAMPPTPHDIKLAFDLPTGAEAEEMFKIDARLEPRPNERIVIKRYASSFKGTNFSEMLVGLSIDTLIVAGISTSHCVYATCRDATDSYRVIVPEEAVGERCELMHEVNLLDIDIDLADVMPVQEVCDQMQQRYGK